MSEPGDSATPSDALEPEAVSAGAMLRAARERRGLHIAALAAAIKVSPRKLEALEADRHADLPDMTFTRALAQTVCRALKIDAEAVLARLPQAGNMSGLSQVGAGLNAPYREAPGSRDPGEFTLLRKPVFWVTVAVLLGALTLALWPEHWMPWRVATATPAAKPAPPAAAPAVAPATLVAPATPTVPDGPAVAGASSAALVTVASQIETVHSAPPPPVGSSAPVADAPAGVLAVRTSAESWIEVQDGRGQMLLSRTVQPGETVGLNGALPLRLTVGNAAVTQVIFRGQPVDLAASTRDNVARLLLR